jgi:hypothetical protein
VNVAESPNITTWQPQPIGRKCDWQGSAEASGSRQDAHDGSKPSGRDSRHNLWGLFGLDPRPWRHDLLFFHLHDVVIGITIDEFVEGIDSRPSGALVDA